MYVVVHSTMHASSWCCFIVSYARPFKVTLGNSLSQENVAHKLRYGLCCTCCHSTVLYRYNNRGLEVRESYSTVLVALWYCTAPQLSPIRRHAYSVSLKLRYYSWCGFRVLYRYCAVRKVFRYDVNCQRSTITVQYCTVRTVNYSKRYRSYIINHKEWCENGF